LGDNVKKIKVLVIDDSAVARTMISRELGKDPEIEVIGTATDPFVARDRILELNPDVLTLDIEMPRMDGFTFLKRLMEFHPLPIVIVSSLTPRGSALALDALSEGAVEVVCKTMAAYTVGDIGPELIAKVKIAAKTKVVKKISKARISENPQALSKLKTTQKMVAIGASTGGVQAIRSLLLSLPSEVPGIVVVQHMPAQFTKAFAERLNEESKLKVVEAKDGDLIRPGCVHIAPGNMHMSVCRSGNLLETKVYMDQRVSGHRPSVDILFNSIAENVGQNAIGVILTGMGADGASGLLSMKSKGALTIAQNEETCVVFGMPKEAIQLGGVDHVVGLQDIPSKIIQLLQSME
jgi:two-component system chemotaxis response regulator CheB